MKKLLHRTMMICVLCLSTATALAQGETGQRNPGTREQIIYKTDFTNWTESLHDTNQETAGVQNAKTGYTEENITFTFSGVDVVPTGTNNGYTGYVQAMKTGGSGSDYTTAAKTYIETSEFKAVKKVTFTHVATGSNRGWRLLAKGDGDEEWNVVIADVVGTTPTQVTVNVGKTNCKLRFENIAPAEFAYLLDLQVYADIDMTKFPMLGNFTANGKTSDYNGTSNRYAGTYISFSGTFTQFFQPDENGNFVNTYEMKRADAILSETNPITVTTSGSNSGWGKVLTDKITYVTTGEGTDAQQTVVTIPVTLESLNKTVNFVATFKLLPWMDVTYYGVDGEREIGVQKVEKFSPIDEYEYTGEDVNNVTPIPNGETFRGWFAKENSNIRTSTSATSNTERLAEQKILETDVVVEPIKLKAKASEIETQESGSTWTFNLNNFFYPEDHENFNYRDDSGHQYAHGRYRATYNGGNYWFYGDEKIELNVSGKADITFTLQRGGTNYQIILTKMDDDNVVWSDTIYSLVTNNGETRTIQYRPADGEPATLLMTFTGATYVKSIVINNLEEEINPIEGTNWYVVKKGDAKSFINTLTAVNNNTNVDFEGNLERVFVYIPAGTYDLGQTMVTLSRDSVSLIGENFEKTIIKNQPLSNGGTGTSAFTFRNTSKQLYMQDLSLENHFDFYGNTNNQAQAFAFWDRGDSTICKNVRLFGHQDTYYSDNNAGKFYWENAQIHGVVDFICGHGTALFADTRLVLEPSRNGNGIITIGTPYTEVYRLDNSDESTERDAFGYVFNGCYIDASKLSSNEVYTLGRSWGGTPRMTWLNTTLSHQKSDYTLDSNIFTTECMEAFPYWFKIYNTTDNTGSHSDNIDDEYSRTFSLSDDISQATQDLDLHLSTIYGVYNDDKYENGDDYENWSGDGGMVYPNKFAPFLYKPEYYTPEHLFYDWNPTNDTKQLSLAEESLVYDEGNELIQWDPVEDAIAYAVYAGDEMIGIVLPDNETFDVQGYLANKYSVRVANAMGGLGLPTEVAAPDVITVQLDDQTMVYGDALPEFTYTSTEQLDGALDIFCYEVPDTKVVSSATGVGEYTITGEKGGATGRIVVLPGKLTITRAPLTVSVKADLTIQETETPQPEIAYSGFKNSDTAASVFTADNLPVVSLNSDTYTLSSSLPVGEYEMIVSGPEETDNYTVTYVNYPVKLLTVTMLDGIEVINASAPLTVYTLQGVKVKRVKSVDEFNKLDSGIYIVKQGNETFKVHKN